jgi:hypothetical protein
LALLALPILLLFCILSAYRAPLPASLSGSQDLAAALATGLAGAGYLLALALYLLWSVRRSARALDPILEPLGLVGTGCTGFGRRYTGSIDGRSVEVRYLPAIALGVARLGLLVEAQPDTRMVVSRERPLLDCRDCRQVDLGEGAPYQVYAQDVHNARRLLDDPAISEALDRVMSAKGGTELYLQPDRIWLCARPRNVAKEELEGWLRELMSLATACS